MDLSDYKYVFLHSDINKFLIRSDVNITLFCYDGPYRRQVLEAFNAEIRSQFCNADLWIPTFNYDFCTFGQFDKLNSPSQLGLFSEFFRVELSSWRTNVPIFSVAGSGVNPLDDLSNELIDPFGSNSIFSQLVSKNGALVSYGCRFSPTFIHFIERLHSDGPLYRYDKLFAGTIINKDLLQAVNVIYHVIPKGLSILYDTEKVLSDLSENGIAVSIDDREIYIVDAAGMLEFCLDKLQYDPLYFLKYDSAVSVSNMLAKLGRRFKIDDFNDYHRDFSNGV
jgi:aminoglycoside 3-N-acetyltransferase